MEKNNGKKDSNQSSKFPPNSIGGMLDEALRQKLLKIQTNQHDQNPKNSVQGKRSSKQP
jgi:hypothetical protein